MNTPLIAWPPPFTLHWSLRARSIRLHICKRRGLRLIVPRGFNIKNTSQVLEQHKKWIERHWIPIEASISGDEFVLPKNINLLALSETWDTDQLISCDKTHPLEVKKILQKWLKTRAEIILIPWLKKLSLETNLAFSKVSIRNTHTRWGSCSVKKNISLNCKLLFLPSILVEHVLLHELCHTVHLNHSKKFWDLLKHYHPDTLNLRKQLKQAQHFIPDWVEK